MLGRRPRQPSATSTTIIRDHPDLLPPRETLRRGHDAQSFTAGRVGGVSQPLAEPEHLPPATEDLVRAYAAELVGVAARHGITDLAFASPGRLRGHVGDDRDLFDMFEFQREATALIGAEVVLYSDGALRNEHVSPDLVAAAPL